jgi:hypothetical protein
MKIRKLAARLAGSLLSASLICPASFAQVSPERLHAIRSRLQQIRILSERMPASQRKVLSSGALNLFEVADKFDDIEGAVNRRQPSSLSVTSQQAIPGMPLEATDGVVRVSNPAQDIFSVLSGFTQSETHTAWCGNNVVVGFNDSGSFFESLVANVGGVSFNGVARSTNQGASYTDLTFLNPGSDVFNFLAGDPVIGCADANTFYYASLFESGPPSAPVTEISVSKSTDGGLTFADPVPAVSKDGFTHFLDKDWMAVDPSNPLRLYVTYTDFDFTGKLCGTDPSGLPIPRTGIELVRSTDGGATWSPPLVINQVCASSAFASTPFLQGSQVTVDAAGKVYVAWEFFDRDFVTREIRVRKSNSNGKSFEPRVKVNGVACSGDCFALQGGFRAFIDLQSLAVDRSATSTKGHVYIGWHDSRFVQFPDLASPTGFYGYADALVSISSDGGANWSAPVRINQNTEPLSNGRGTDQYMPGIAVDNTGRVEACFYDRRLDPGNFFFDRFCALSADGGQTWTDSRQTSSSSPPFHATDTFINPFYMGDYDGMASDFTGANNGFVGAFQIISRRGDPNVFAVKLP